MKMREWKMEHQCPNLVTAMLLHRRAPRQRGDYQIEIRTVPKGGLKCFGFPEIVCPA
jgi:hypothetical protein